MSVRFVIGRAGSGKTRRFFRGIVEALRADPLGAPIYWILPRQATFIAEHELTVAGGLGGFCRARVLSFDELGRELLAECGGSSVPRITSLGRQMILGHLLGRLGPQLQFFSKVARQPGMAARLEAAFAEFERCGRDPEALTALVSQMTGDADAEALRAKLHDIGLIYKAYTDYLGQERLDPRQWMAQVLSRIVQSKRLAGATVYVDAFSELEEFERRVLARLGRVCGRMEISLLMDPSSPVLRNPELASAELGVFHPVEDTYRRLVKALADEAVNIEPPVLLTEARRFAEPSLGEVERAMVDGAGPSSATLDPTGIELLESPTRRDEVEHAARHIGRLLASGLRMRDITVLTRKIELYADLISAVFREHDIRFFLDMRRPMAHHPLLMFMRAALDIVLQKWEHESVMLLIKSGLCGLRDAQADRLENYVLEHHVRGAAWSQEQPWNWRRELSRGDEDEQALAEHDESAEMDGLRRQVRDGVGPLLAMFADDNVTHTVGETVAAVYELFDRFAVSRTLSRWIAAARAAQKHEQAGEHERVWSELGGLFDQMVDLLGDEPVTLEGFREILDAGLETFSLGIAPPTVDEVIVGPIDRTRTHAVKAVLLLGMNEGVFPSVPAEGSILSDHDRLELERRQFELEPGSERRLLDEDFLAYLAFTRASEHLYLSRSLADDAARPLAASPYWHRLMHILPRLRPRALPHDVRADAALIATPRQLVTGVLQWARGRIGDAGAAADAAADVETSQAGDPWPALYHWLATYPPADDAIDRLRYRAWGALSYVNDASLSPRISSKLFSTPLAVGVSQIEVFASCPFRHFARYVLGLEQRDEEGPIALDLAGAFHQILENIVRQLLRKREGWSELAPQEAEQLVQTYARQVAQSLHGELMLSNARNRYLLGRIERTLGQVIAAQQAAAARGQFTTAFGRVEFGSDGAALGPLAISTPKGQELRIRGRIDRVDLLESEAAFAVMDYRLRGDTLSLARVYHGLSLQLLTYMLLIRDRADSLVGKALTPAGAFYVRLMRELEKVDHPDDAVGPEDPGFALAHKPRGIFDGRYFSAFDNTGDTGSSQVLAARINKDGSFGSKKSTDVAEGDELPALLEFVRQQLGQLGDRIMGGEIEVRPYRMGTSTPCPACPYHSVCRFDPAINHYRHIAQKNREEVLQAVCEEGGHAG